MEQRFADQRISIPRAPSSEQVVPTQLQDVIEAPLAHMIHLPHPVQETTRIYQSQIREGEIEVRVVPDLTPWRATGVLSEGNIVHIGDCRNNGRADSAAD